MKRIFVIGALTAALVALTSGSSVDAAGFHGGHGGHHGGHHANSHSYGHHGYGNNGYGNGSYGNSGYGYGAIQSYRPSYGHGSSYRAPAYGLGYPSGYGGGYAPLQRPNSGGVHLGVGRFHLDLGNPHGF